MFNYNKNTEVNIPFKLLELFRTIKADKKVKADADNVVSVKLANTLSPAKTGLEPSDNVKEIYVIDIDLNSNKVPILFLDAFNKYIEFQTLFRLHYKDECKYVSSIKVFDEEKMKVLKTFETNWKKVEIQSLPITTKLDTLFKNMIQYITSYSFRQDESFEDYISRLDTIKKLQLDILKQTKIMNAEKQPNLRMALNDKIKLMKKELQEWDGR